ncbi:MAG: GNAT family N-acetyltransferase, partial [Verrucomicrobiota bacterium]
NRYTYIKDAQYSMAEFFIMPKYRKLGMGKHLASQLFQTFSGRWEVRTHAANASGAAFWRKIIALATEGVFDEFPNGNDRWKGPIWTFEAV